MPIEGEIAIRIARAAADSGIRSVAIFSADDKASLHKNISDEAILIPGAGPLAYLDIDAIISAAKKSGCNAIHPGYGFLSERADFAMRCREANILFIGPQPEHLTLFGDKVSARKSRDGCGCACASRQRSIGNDR